ncbi:polysaccharide lyase family 7 protein [Psychromonas sp. PT13]|uniref:polysaccharide lyase family 7 protein n=1 Tax=Psychromonas sp. PT13 TaxID=3439547 RepID=UPI003EB7F3E9
MKQRKLRTFLATSILIALAGCGTEEVVMKPTPPPVTSEASGSDGNGPERTLDGDITTRWSASGDGAWISYDYGQELTFNAVKIAFHKGDKRASVFDIEISKDGKTWTPVLSNVISSGNTLDLQQFDFDEVSGQYIKLIGHGNTSNKWNSVTEFVAANCNVDECAEPTTVRSPALIPVAVSGSLDDGNGPERLIDGDLKTRWSSKEKDAWAILDYGKVAEFDAVRLAFNKGDERNTIFGIAVSTDGKTWTEVINKTQSSGELNTYERFEFEPVKAQYIKYIGYGNSKSNWNSVTEFSALNCSINDCPVNEIITPEVIAAAKAAAAEKAKIKNDGPASTLANWKLTVPETNAGFYGASVEKQDSVAEILPGNCSADKSSLDEKTNNTYFSADKNGWHFRVPLEGGKTTPNSTYIRSELRELANDWQPCDDSGAANWSYGGTHTLISTLTLDEIPANPLKKDGKTPDAPKVVLGQIHAKDVHAATVKLLWEGAEKPVRVILNKSTEKSAFSVKLGKVADPSKPWTYMIKMTPDGIELAAGGVTKKLKFGKELDNAWKQEKFYFKAGLYPQVYKESGGAFAATFSKISLKHTARDGDFGTHVPLECDAAVNDCSKAVWWDVPLKAPTIPAKPLPGNKPSQNFDLTTWYLSQPFDHDANGKPDDVMEQYLAQGYEQPEHFYTAADGGLVFKSFIKGVRTSNNTHYVRTEMREMLRAGDDSIPLKGVTKNNWVFSSAPIEDQMAAGAIDGVMENTLKIDHTTTTGEANQVGRFIIGQIHDKDDEPIRLYYRKLPNEETGSLYFAHENSKEGSDNYYNLVGDISGKAGPDGIKLGEVFTYRIEVVGNTMTVTLKRDGKPDVEQVVDMSKSGYDVGGRYMYFKVGVYNQNNTGDPEDYVQATFYKITKSHSQYQK